MKIDIDFILANRYNKNYYVACNYKDYNAMNYVQAL